MIWLVVALLVVVIVGQFFAYAALSNRIAELDRGIAQWLSRYRN